MKGSQEDALGLALPFWWIEVAAALDVTQVVHFLPQTVGSVLQVVDEDHQFRPGEAG